MRGRDQRDLTVCYAAVPWNQWCERAARRIAVGPNVHKLTTRPSLVGMTSSDQNVRNSRHAARYELLEWQSDHIHNQRVELKGPVEPSGGPSVRCTFEVQHPAERLRAAAA